MEEKKDFQDVQYCLTKQEIEAMIKVFKVYEYEESTEWKKIAQDLRNLKNQPDQHSLLEVFKQIIELRSKAARSGMLLAMYATRY